MCTPNGMGLRAPALTGDGGLFASGVQCDDVCVCALPAEFDGIPDDAPVTESRLVRVWIGSTDNDGLPL